MIRINVDVNVFITSDASGSKMSGSGTGRVLEVGTRDGSGTHDSYPGFCFRVPGYPSGSKVA